MKLKKHIRPLFINANSKHIPIADGSVQMIICSPPYYNGRPEYSSWPDYTSYLADMLRIWKECFRVLCDGGWIAVNVPMGYGRPSTGGYVCIGDHTTQALCSVGFDLRGHIIWNKKVFGGDGLARLGGTAWGSWLSASDPCLRDMHEIIIVAHKGKSYRGPGPDTINKETFIYATSSIWDIAPATSPWHPAPFPAEIPRRLIELYTFKGDIVLDPFSGSGTTVHVAQSLGREGIGLELKLDYLLKVTEEIRFQKNGWSEPQKPVRITKERRKKKDKKTNQIDLFN